jgi:hypothetical protein
MIFWRLTSRGFARGEFKDLYGADCYTQKSSIADVDAIWLGLNGEAMHLTQEMAGNLGRILTRFSETGNLNDPDVSPTS